MVWTTTLFALSTRPEVCGGIRAGAKVHTRGTGKGDLTRFRRNHHVPAPGADSAGCWANSNH